MKSISWLIILLSQFYLLSFCEPQILEYLLTDDDDEDDEPDEPDERHEETRITAPDMIRQAGFEVESHVVVTEDGYFLTLHRIPASTKNATAVLLQHGLLSSSVDWVVTGKDKGFAYMLADKGYDVWMGNARGNTYSRKHKVYDQKNPRFWKFSWHEMGVYDLPAVISYITNIKNDSLIYIGHSMGTTMFYVMATQRQDIASKVRVMLSLAPAVFLQNLKSPIKLLVPFTGIVEAFTNLFNLHEFLPRNYLTEFLARYGCKHDIVVDAVCANILFTISGFNRKQFNSTLLPIILDHAPAGASTLSVLHFVQVIDSGKFRQYDHGEDDNRKIYHQKKPPKYDLSKIKVPIAIFYADNDLLISPKDVFKLYDKLPNTIGLHKVPYNAFTHFDFLWAINAPTLVYKRILPILERYKNK